MVRSPSDARALFEAVAELLALVAERGPLVVLLEDLHWADAELHPLRARALS